MVSVSSRTIFAASVALMLGLSSAHAAVVNDTNTNATPNGSFATAQGVDSSFTTEYRDYVPNAGVAGWEWVSIHDSAPRVPAETTPYYSFSVFSGQSFIFDVDFADERESGQSSDADFDSLIELFVGSDDAGVLNPEDFLAANNDAPLPADPGSENSTQFPGAAPTHIYDSYLVYTFAYTGHAVIKLSDDGSGLEYGEYELQISRSLSPVPVPAAVWLFGSALIGFVGMSRRRSIKT